MFGCFSVCSIPVPGLTHRGGGTEQLQWVLQLQVLSGKSVAVWAADATQGRVEGCSPYVGHVLQGCCLHGACWWLGLSQCINVPLLCFGSCRKLELHRSAFLVITEVGTLTREPKRCSVPFWFPRRKRKALLSSLFILFYFILFYFILFYFIWNLSPRLLSWCLFFFLFFLVFVCHNPVTLISGNRRWAMQLWFFFIYLKKFC